LGAGAGTFAEERTELVAGTLLALYTDGLVERRDRVIDTGIDALAGSLSAAQRPIVPETVVSELVPDGSDDDIALLVAHVLDAPAQVSATLHVEADTKSLREARRFVEATLEAWELPEALRADALLLCGELLANAILHGRPPIELRLRRGPPTTMAAGCS
jgi:hypothetical protein